MTDGDTRTGVHEATLFYNAYREMGQIFQWDKHLFVLLNTYLAFASVWFARSEFQWGIFKKLIFNLILQS